MLTRSDFVEFKKDFKKAIKDVEDKYNIDISINRITYSDIMFKMTLEAISKELECSVEEMKFKKPTELS